MVDPYTISQHDPDPDSQKDSLRLDELRDYCRNRDLEAIYPRRGHVLLLDIDGSLEWNPPLEDPDRLIGGIKRIYQTISKGRNGLHVYIEAEDESLSGTPYKFLIQATLGSDVVREALSGLRWSKPEDSSYPNVLFEPLGFLDRLTQHDPEWRNLLGLVPLDE